MALQRDAGARDLPSAVSSGDGPYGAWLALADALIASLTALDRYITARTADPRSDEAASELLTTREYLQQGVAQAAAQLAQLIGTSGPNGEGAASSAMAHQQPFDHPLVQLARAYGTAFGAVETAAGALSVPPTEQLPAAAGRLVAQAIKAAKGLRQAMHLAFGQQGLGTVQLVCDHIATFENQADALYHSAVAAYLSSRKVAGERSPWTQGDAAYIRRLAALEALTDRCEDVAEALQLAEHLI